MKFINLIAVFVLCLVSEFCYARPIIAKTITGDFKRCVNGICDKVFELFFVTNPCFELNEELGISFFIKNKKYAGQLNADYEILSTNCTIESAEIKEAIDFYNFVNDKYDIVYLVLLAAAKITIGVLAFFLLKFTKRNKSNYNIFFEIISFQYLIEYL